MAETEFQIPPLGEWNTSIAGQCKVPDHQIPRKLEECRKDIVSRRSDVVHYWFPLLQQVASNVAANDSGSSELCWQIVVEGLRLQTEDLLRLDLGQLDQDLKMTLRSSVKMLCFLAVTMAMKFESEVGIGVTAKPSKRRPKGPSAWTDQRLKVVKMLLRVYSSDVCQLWEPPSVAMMEDFSILVTSVCYKMLENPAVVREKTLLQTIAQLLGLAASKYGLMLSVSLKLIQLLQHFEHLCNVLSTIVGVAVRTQSCTAMVATIVREIGSKDPADLLMDGGGTKSLAAFLVSLSGDLAGHVMPAMTSLLPHLNGESITFRNGVLGVIGEMLRQLPCSELGPMTPEARDMMIQHLIGHVHDTHALVRVRSLHVLLQLADIQALPLPILPLLLERVSGRLRDKSSLVRKAALQLLSTSLSKNPYSAKLDRTQFMDKLMEEEQLFKAMGLEDMDSEEIAKNHTIIDFLKAALDFSSAMSSCVPLAIDLLKSKVTSDVLEAMEFLRVCQLFQIEGADEGISKCLPLIWSQDEQIRKAVVITYDSIYLATSDRVGSKQHAHMVLKNLLQLVSKATTGQKASLEKLVDELLCAKCLPDLTLKELWEVYCGGQQDQQVLASLLLAMTTATQDTEGLTVALLDRLMTRGLNSSSGVLLASQTCSIIVRIKDGQESTRLPTHHRMFECIVQLLKTHFTDLNSSQWAPFCEQAVQVVYLWAQHPDSICQQLLQDLTRMCFQSEGDVNSVVLSRLLHCVGHVAQWQLIHCEHTIYNHRRKLLTTDKEKPQSKGEVEEDLGLVAGEDQEVELMRRVMELEVGGADGFLLVFEPLVVSVVANPRKYPCDQLQTAAALALAKFMLISSNLCDKYLQLLFTILEKSEEPTIRANLIVAASDLVCRFPNLIEPWTPLMYNRLRDDCVLVRKNTMMVLTHLILNDMVKVRGQISSMALCLKDEDSSIMDMAHMFFYELSLKGNTLYNVVPDIISQLSDPSCGTTSTIFKDVIGHLFKLIKKERQQESLIEKLCHRLRAVRVEEQAQNLAYCLSLVTPTEKGLLQFQENFCCYQDHLLDSLVLKFLLNYINKAKKTGKNEVKNLAEELENMMCEYTQRGRHEMSQSSLETSPSQ